MVEDLDIGSLAVEVIEKARERFGSISKFDDLVADSGIARYGRLYDEVYMLANNVSEPPSGNEPMTVLIERKDRAAELWDRVLPDLKKYSDECFQQKLGPTLTSRKGSLNASAH